MIALFGLSLLLSIQGEYVSHIGQVGAGGLEARLFLGPKGEYKYRRRGCFVDGTTQGTYRIERGTVSLTPDSAIEDRESAGVCDGRFHIVRRGFRIYLLTDSEQERFVDEKHRRKLAESIFLIKS